MQYEVERCKKSSMRQNAAKKGGMRPSAVKKGSMRQSTKKKWSMRHKFNPIRRQQSKSRGKAPTQLSFRQFCRSRYRSRLRLCLGSIDSSQSLFKELRTMLFGMNIIGKFLLNRRFKTPRFVHPPKLINFYSYLYLLYTSKVLKKSPPYTAKQWYIMSIFIVQ